MTLGAEMLIKFMAWLVMTIVFGLLLAAASDGWLGPVTGVQFDGSFSYSKVLSFYSFEILAYLVKNANAALASPTEFYAAIQRSQLVENLLQRMALIAVVSACLSYAFNSMWRGKNKTDPQISGMKLLSDSAAQDDAKRQFQKEIGNKPRKNLATVYLAPGMPISPSQETRGIFIEGAVGSGKTVAIDFILRQAIARGDKIILYDTKGDFAPKIAERIVLNPFAVGSAVWAIARDVQTADQARQLARMLVPSETGKDDFWSNAANAILSGIFIVLQSEKPQRWTFRDVLGMLLSPREAVIEKLKQHSPTAAMFFGEKGGTSVEQGVLATLSAKLSPFIEPLAISWGDPSDQVTGFSFGSWLLSEDTETKVIVLQGSPEHADAASAWIRMAINFIAGIVVSPRVENDGPLRLWLFVDELPSLGSVPRLADIVDRGRQKGVRTVVACQSLAQLALHYADWAQSAESTFGIRILGKMSPGERTQAIGRSIGERHVKTLTVTKTHSADGSTTRSLRPGAERVPVISPDVFGSLGEQSQGGIDALVVGLTSNILRAHWPFPPKRPNYHPPFKLRDMDRNVLRISPAQPTQPGVTVSKSIGLKLDDAIEEFEAKKPRTKV